MLRICLGYAKESQPQQQSASFSGSGNSRGSNSGAAAAEAEAGAAAAAEAAAAARGTAAEPGAAADTTPTFATLARAEMCEHPESGRKNTSRMQKYVRNLRAVIKETRCTQTKQAGHAHLAGHSSLGDTWQALS